jgi:DDE superfamily endonuclease
MCLSSDPLVMLLQAKASVFTRPTFSHVLLLVCGTLLASGRRTITAALRAVGQGKERHFTSYHRVLNRAVWSPLSLSPNPLTVARQNLLGSQCTLDPAPGWHTRTTLGKADRL